MSFRIIKGNSRDECLKEPSEIWYHASGSHDLTNKEAFINKFKASKLKQWDQSWASNKLDDLCQKMLQEKSKTLLCQKNVSPRELLDLI